MIYSTFPMQSLMVLIVIIILAISIPLFIESLFLFSHYKKKNNIKLQKTSKIKLIISIVLIACATILYSLLLGNVDLTLCGLNISYMKIINVLFGILFIYGLIHIPYAIYLFLKKKPGVMKALFKAFVWFVFTFFFLLSINFCPYISY